MNDVGWNLTQTIHAVKLGVCHTPSSTCPEYSSNSCGCPDCSKHLIPPHLHAYCSALEDSGSSNNQGESDDSVSYTKDTTEESYFGDRSVGGQSTTRVFKLWMVVAMGFAILALVVGVASRRVSGGTHASINNLTCFVASRKTDFAIGDRLQIGVGRWFYWRR